MSRTRIRRMSIDQHILLGNELKTAEESIASILNGEDYQGLVPKKVVRKLAKVTKYLSSSRSEMGEIAGRQHPEVDSGLVANIYRGGESSTGTGSQESES